MSKIRGLMYDILFALTGGSGGEARRARTARGNPFLRVLWTAGVGLAVVGLFMWGPADPVESRHSTGWALLMTGVFVLVVALAVSAVLWHRDRR